MVGIYKITNKINGKVYIGQSKYIERRWNRHRSAAFNPNDHNYNIHLYRAIRKYGLENFSFEVLEECKVEELNEKEVYYIKLYNSFFEGYNLTLGGDSSAIGVNKEKIIGIIHDLETTNIFHREIAEKWDISQEMVQGINTGRYWKQDREYPIQAISKKRCGEKREQKYCIDCGTKIDYKSIRCVKCNQLFSRTVKRPSRDELKELIRTKTFVEIGKRYGVNDNTIRKWCDFEKLPRRKKDINNYTDEEWALI